MPVNRVKGWRGCFLVCGLGVEMIYFEKVITFLENKGFLVLLHNGRQTNSRTTAQVHGKHQEQEHEARGDCAEIPFRTWLPFPYQCEASAWYTGYCLEEISYLHLCERMLLART